MASSPFERQVVEADSADDRSPVSSRMSDGPQQYEPGPSFVEHDRPSIRLVELPAWLQSFASSVGEPSEAEIAGPLEETQAEEQSVPKPEQRRPDDPPAPSDSAKIPSRGVSSDFISEDDLPEWLRSIAPEDSSDVSADTLLDRSDEGEHLPVPNVARAWSTSKDSRGVDEATSLFALVASQTPQHALPDSESSSQTSQRSTHAKVASSGVVEQYGTSRPPGEEPAASDAAAEATADSAGAKRSGPPLLLIIVGLILILVLVGSAAAVFLM